MRFKFNLIITFLVTLNISATRCAMACSDRVCNNALVKVDVDSINTDKIENLVSVEDKKWVKDLSDSSINMVFQNLKENFAKQEELEREKSNLNTNISYQEQEIIRRPSGLYIFVSTSMSKQLLRTYANEAGKYGGVLVLKGLPNNSFKELSKLVTELVDTKDQNQRKDLEISQNSNFQIDDEAFDKFNITSVPTIILSREDKYFPNQNEKVIYDKIIGNVGIKYALRQFSETGELQKEASEILDVSENH